MLTALESLQRMFAVSLDSPQKAVLSHLQTASTHNDRVTERIELYRSAIRVRWRAALANAYPVLHAQLGEEAFDKLATAYAQAHPSQSGDLNRFGATLPAFVEGYAIKPRLCYLADLARLEWSLHEAYFAADAEVLAQEAWLAIRPDDLLAARLAVHPACTLISSPYAIADIWRAHQMNESLPVDIASPTHALVVRPHWRPELLTQSVAANSAFDALQRGTTLDEALDAAFGIDAEFDFTSQWRAWISASAIVGIM